MRDSSALVVIDMQNDLCRDVRRATKVDEMLAPLRRLIDGFAHRGNLIVYTRFSLSEGDEQFARFGDKYCIEGTKGAEFIDEMRPLRGPVIRKRKHSAFFETELDEILREDGISDVYLCGLQTHICIMTTAADASFRGYRAIAVADCVVSSQEQNKIQALEWIRRYVGEVQLSEEVLGSG